MGAMCKSDAYQNTKHKKKFESQANRNTWETHRVKRVKRAEKQAVKHENHLVKRAIAGKPQRGAARAKRREVMPA